MQVYAVEKSPDAAKWTHCNVERYSLQDKVQVRSLKQLLKGTFLGNTSACPCKDTLSSEMREYEQHAQHQPRHAQGGSPLAV